MPRKTFSQPLTQLPSAAEIEGAEHRTNRLLEIMRDAAIKNQGEQPDTFYSLRTVAARFRVPVSMVGRVYGRLEQEGLLSRVRGNKTVLQGRVYDRQLRVRAFVGLPVSLLRFITLQDYRTFLIQVRRELRLWGFAPVTMFVDDQSATDIADRLQQCQADTALWFLPGQFAARASVLMAEKGIRVIGVSDGGEPRLPCRYQIRRDKALACLRRDWLSSNVSSVSIVSEATTASSADERRLRNLFAKNPMECRVVRINDDCIQKCLFAALANRNAGLILLSSAASMIAFRVPHILEKLTRSVRVALVNGSVAIPFVKPMRVEVDLITVDWTAVAKRIVTDLISQEAFLTKSPKSFEASYRPRTLLRAHVGHL